MTFRTKCQTDIFQKIVRKKCGLGTVLHKVRLKPDIFSPYINGFTLEHQVV